MITVDQIVTYLNPEGNSNKFQSAPVIDAVNRAILSGTAIIQGHMPEEYRALQTVIPGLVLTRDAIEGDTVYTIPSWIEYTSGKIWRNLDTPWRSRRQADIESFTFNPLTNEITMEEASEEGDSLVMEIHHTSDYPEVLQALALDIVADELYSIMPRLLSSEDYDRWSLRIQNKYAMLRELRRGMIRINAWDDLDLLAENETITRQGKGYLNPNGW